ncbi:MAG: DUF4255 domain-containing protein [Minicystis sp.]
MSNTLAIAAVTAALRNRLTAALEADQGSPTLSGTDVTTLPMDQAFEPQTPDDTVGNCLNIFLYHVVPTAGLRNRTTPQQARSGETASPPLALTLHYMISAYGNGGDDITAHRLLGAAMASLHDQPLLTAEELKALADGDIYRQVERVRITEQPLTTEEMYKLWSAFQTHYRVSAAYEVSVVLIDTARPIKAAFPALQIITPSDPATPGEPSPVVVPRIDLAPAYPTITAVTPPGGKDYAFLDEDLTISGLHLNDDPAATVTALLSHPLLPKVVRLPVTITSGVITVSVPAAYPISGTPDFTLPAGVYTLSLEIVPPGKPPLVSNEVPFRLAPEILSLTATTVELDVHGEAAVELEVSPEVWPGQRVYLILGAQGFPLRPAITSQSGTLDMSVAVAPGDYLVRLRVDGVDSPLLHPTTGLTPALAPTLTITPYTP